MRAFKTSSQKCLTHSASRPLERASTFSLSLHPAGPADAGLHRAAIAACAQGGAWPAALAVLAAARAERRGRPPATEKSVLWTAVEE